MAVTDDQVAGAIVVLLHDRPATATICPSEAARALAPGDWRRLMPQVREVAVALAKDGIIDIRQGGRVQPPHLPLRGPLRLAQPHADAAAGEPYPSTPDGRYFVVRGRLWRKANPNLPGEVRDRLVRQLMDARRALRGRRPDAERAAARARVDAAKRALGERGPAWWTDGAPDYNRKLARNTPYAQWYSGSRLED